MAVRVTVEERDPKTGEVRVVEREEERVVGFHVTYVFDVSQTEEKPLPEPPKEKKVPGGFGVDDPKARRKYGGNSRVCGEAIAEGAALSAAQHFGWNTSG